MASTWATSGGTDLALLFNTVVGTFLVASGAAAFNQVLERDVDATDAPDDAAAPAGWSHRQRRGVLVRHGAVGDRAGAAVVRRQPSGGDGRSRDDSSATRSIYTPLKKVTSLATVVGAVPGALPPVIGWAAARDTLSIEAWVLFAIVFFWQMPHVLAISWLYRDDYERGGIRVLPSRSPTGAAPRSRW